MKYILIVFVSASLLFSCTKEETINPDSLITYAKYYTLGCTPSDTIFLFLVPSAFTPNGDGINEFFFPVGIGWGNSNYKMEIYDRYGSKMFETDNPIKGWEGKAFGGNDLAPEGLYNCILEVDECSGVHHTYTRTISLIK